MKLWNWARTRPFDSIQTLIALLSLLAAFGWRPSYQPIASQWYWIRWVVVVIALAVGVRVLAPYVRVRLRGQLTARAAAPWESESGEWEKLGHRSSLAQVMEQQTSAIAWPVPVAQPISWIEVEIRVPEDANNALVRAGVDVMGPDGAGQIARLLVASDGNALLWHRGPDGHQRDVPYGRECGPGHWYTLRLERTAAGFTYGINGDENVQRMERWPPRVRLRLHTSCWPGGHGVAYYKNLRYG